MIAYTVLSNVRLCMGGEGEGEGEGEEDSLLGGGM